MLFTISLRVIVFSLLLDGILVHFILLPRMQLETVITANV